MEVVQVPRALTLACRTGWRQCAVQGPSSCMGGWAGAAWGPRGLLPVCRTKWRQHGVLGPWGPVNSMCPWRLGGEGRGELPQAAEALLAAEGWEASADLQLATTRRCRLFTSVCTPYALPMQGLVGAVWFESKCAGLILRLGSSPAHGSVPYSSFGPWGHKVEHHYFRGWWEKTNENNSKQYNAVEETETLLIAADNRLKPCMMRLP